MSSGSVSAVAVQLDKWKDSETYIYVDVVNRLRHSHLLSTDRRVFKLFSISLVSNLILSSNLHTIDTLIDGTYNNPCEAWSLHKQAQRSCHCQRFSEIGIAVKDISLIFSWYSYYNTNTNCHLSDTVDWSLIREIVYKSVFESRQQICNNCRNSEGLFMCRLFSYLSTNSLRF